MLLFRIDTTIMLIKLSKKSALEESLPFSPEEGLKIPRSKLRAMRRACSTHETVSGILFGKRLHKK